MDKANRNTGKAATEDEIGVCDVAITKAKGLPKMDLTGLCDPYATVMVASLNHEGKIQKTEYIRRNLNPVWNKTYSFPVRRLAQVVTVKVYDHDDLGTDDLIGSYQIKVADFQGNDLDDWFELKDEKDEVIIGEDGTNSRVHLNLKYTPHVDRELGMLHESIYSLGVGEDNVRDAIKRAAGSVPRKRVLLQIGADWCETCKRMYFLLSEDLQVAGACNTYFELCLVDADHEDNFPLLAKMGDPQWLGFPVFVILTGKGEYVTTVGTGTLEKDPIVTSEEPDKNKLLRFMTYWRPGGPTDTTRDTTEPET
mmetsp:Transcript_43238/g.102868  ORF Transcript_43238/g.102868 Transcript_43238/m.102868 type:complete len:309 (+) Transcript_43238:133-1059(+)